MSKLKDYRNLPLPNRSYINNFGQDTFTKNLISLILTANLIYTVGRYSREIVVGGNPYLTGDWLINYEGGYNGRGLFGQALLWFSDTFSLNLLWTAYTFQTGLYFIYFLFVISIFRRIANPFVWMIALSPSFVMFDFLDTGGAFRKEILGFASLILIVQLIIRKTFRNTLIFLSILIFIIFLFSWDAAFCFIPFYIYTFSKLYYKEVITRKSFHTFCIAFFVLGLTSIMRAVYFLYHRPASISEGICKSLTDRGLSPKICGGTIGSITGLDANPVNMIHTLIFDYHFELYFVLLLLGFVPFFLNCWLRPNIVFTILLFISIVPLFVIGADYGRWIHIFGTFVTLAWLIDDTRPAFSRLLPVPRTFISTGTLKFLMLSLIFTNTWRIPVIWGSPADSLLGTIGRSLSWFTNLIG
jgi:hypothetical protein